MDNDTPPPGGSAPPPRADNRFFAWLRSLDIPRQPGWLGGVAAGIAFRLRVDPIIVRGILVVVGVLGAPVLLLYAAAWLLLPDHTGRIHAEELGHGRFDPALAGIAVMALIGLWPGNFSVVGLGFGMPFAWWDGGLARLFGVLWTLALIAAAVWLVIVIVRRSSAAKSAERGATATGTAPGTEHFGSAAAGAAPGGTEAAGATSAAYLADDTAGTSGPAVSSGDATPDELAVWHAQQARFRQERDQLVMNEIDARQQAATARIAEDQRLREVRAAEYRAERERTRSRPLYTLAAIGLALIAGAAVMLTVGRGELPNDAVIAGLATTLGVLGLAIIVNGVMGRRSGGASGMAWIVAFLLVVVGILSIGARVVFAGSLHAEPTYRSGSAETYLVGAGESTVDLTDYWPARRAADETGRSGSVGLFAGAGDVRVVLPDDTVVDLDLRSGAGDIEIDDAAPGIASGYRGWQQVWPEGYDPDSPPENVQYLTVIVYVGAGDITVITEGELQ